MVRSTLRAVLGKRTLTPCMREKLVQAILLDTTDLPLRLPFSQANLHN